MMRGRTVSAFALFCKVPHSPAGGTAGFVSAAGLRLGKGCLTICWDALLVITGAEGAQFLLDACLMEGERAVYASIPSDASVYRPICLEAIRI